LFLYDTVISDPTNWQATQEHFFNRYSENLFLQLTNFDPQTQTVTPELATTWTTNTEATVYTFTLRTDIEWVNYFPPTGETTQETDSEGRRRFVVAEDFVYGIQYFCNPANAVYDSFTVISPTIKGCAAALNSTLSPTPPELLEAIGVHALTDDTLVIELTEPTGYFPIFTSLPVFSALPRWTIETYGQTWLEAGTIVTNGRFVLYEWFHNRRTDLFRNPFMPYDMLGIGNIERVQTTWFPDLESSYAGWRINLGDISAIPDDKLTTHQDEFPKETMFFTNPTVSYLAIRMTKPPFDDVRVRLAFSAAIDRETLVNQLFTGQAMTVQQFVPSSLLGVSPVNEIGIGFAPEYAREQLAAAGYPNCEGLPLTLVGMPDDAQSKLISLFIMSQWQEHLGCEPAQIRVFPCYMYALGSSYPCFEPGPEDANALNFVYRTWPGDNRGIHLWMMAQSCEVTTYSHRSCTEVDEWLAAARATTDSTQRITLYRQIEEALFGPKGEFPVIPLFVRTTPYAQHRWLITTPFSFAGTPWYDWAIDAEVQMKARSEN